MEKKAVSAISLTLILANMWALVLVPVSFGSVIDVLTNGDFENVAWAPVPGGWLPEPVGWSVTWMRGGGWDGQVMARDRHDHPDHIHSGFYSLYVWNGGIRQAIYEHGNLTAEPNMAFVGWIAPQDTPQGWFPAHQPYSGVRIRFYNLSTMGIGFDILYTWCASADTLSQPHTIFVSMNWKEWNLLYRNVSADLHSIYGSIDLSTLALYDLEISGFWDFYADDFSLTTIADAFALTISTNINGVTNPASGTYIHTANSTIQITATPNVGYQFVCWFLDGSPAGSDGPISILMTQNHTLQATFAEVTYQLTIEATAGGTTSPAPGNYTYRAGYNVQVMSSPNTNYAFDYWELDGSNVGSLMTYLFNIEQNHTLRAVFVHLGVHADVNRDSTVDILDVITITSAYDSIPSEPHWNPHADIAEPYGLIDVFDVVTCTIHYGESW